MKILATAALVFMGLSSFGQTDTTEVSVKVITQGNNNTVIVDAQGQKWYQHKKKPNIKTKWFEGLDIGFSNFKDDTKYGSAEANAYAPGSSASWFDLKNGKSINVNLWILSQKINIIRHAVNLKYALGLELNNYRYKNPVRYAENPPYVNWDNTSGRTYSKNKLAADYVTIPMMLNFDFNPKRGSRISYRYEKNKKETFFSAGKEPEWGLSGGISAGYLYSARNKTITSDEGKEKLKDNFNLRPWKIAYVGEINLGYFSLFGSYALKSMYKNGLDMTPYNFGIRL